MAPMWLFIREKYLFAGENKGGIAMEAMTVAAASFAQQKYFLAEDFLTLPEEIKEDIKVLCVLTAQKLGCTFLLDMDEDGDISFRLVREVDDLNFDEIGAELEVKEISRKQKELLHALKLWYTVFKTEEGKKMQEELLKGENA